MCEKSGEGNEERSHTAKGGLRSLSRSRSSSHSSRYPTAKKEKNAANMSGVLPTDECKAEFANLKNKRAYKFITFKINVEAGKTEVLDLHKKEVRFET